MSTAEVINLTGVARKLHASTPNARKKLDNMGVKPIQEINMPSGRTYVLYDRVRVDKALEKLAAGKSAKKAAAPAPVASTVDAKLHKEIRDLKILVSQLLEHATKPQGKPAEASTEFPVSAAS
jgi:hypothetical protein